MRNRPIWERFWEKVRRDGNCLMWQSTVSPRTGYGKFWHEGRQVLAHRMAYILAHGPIPDGAQVLHTCDVRTCVNPKHLRLGTHQDNMRDMVQKGRARSPNKLRTHCQRGHAFTPDNTWTHGRQRVCRTCKVAANQRYQRREAKKHRADQALPVDVTT